MRKADTGQTQADTIQSNGTGILLLPPPRRSPTRVPAKSAASGRIRLEPGICDPAEGLAHDARNLFSALDLYCQLLATPGVLAPDFRHYADDLRVIGQTGGRLIQNLSRALSQARPQPCPQALSQPHPQTLSEPPWSVPPAAGRLPVRHRMPKINDLAAELLGLEATLRALAGPDVRLEIECEPCPGELGLTAEELLRMLFNLVANSVEAMRVGQDGAPRAGRFLRITAQRGGGASFLPPFAVRSGTVVLSVRDNGPGIRAAALSRIFEAGYSTRGRSRHRSDPEQGEAPRGLGLAIVRQLAETAGGAVRAISSPGVGARFDIELPLLRGRPAIRSQASGRDEPPRVRSVNSNNLADFLAKNSEGGVLC